MPVLSVIDATAKVPPGVRMGKFHFVGRWDQCVETEVEHVYNDTELGESELRQFTGRYCRLDMRLGSGSINVVWNIFSFIAV